MARSMTAYGRAHLEMKGESFVIEIHSVNRKSLDVNSNLPKELLPFDIEFRKKIGKKIKRGYVTIRITKGKSAQASPLTNLKPLYEEWTDCAKSLGFDPKEAIPFSMLMQYSLSSPPPIEVDENALMKGFDEALVAFMKMKEVEGSALIEDITPRLKEIDQKIEKVGPLVKKAPKRYHDKLKKKLEELSLNSEVDEERLAKEVVIFADRIDVTEELIRLGSHVKQFEGILKEEKKQVGRELDFLTQEMNREANTIGAKSQELEVTQVVLAIKSALDKIREQLQNIE